MRELLWNAPVSEAKMSMAIESLGLTANQSVMDFGCGSGEVLIRICERYQIRASGIDASAEHIAEANQRSTGRVPENRVQFIEADVQTFSVETNSLDLAICLGATHAFGLGADAYPNSLRQMLPMVACGGQLLVAEGYMKQPASAGYRKLIGDSIPDEMTHAANVATGKQLGLIPLAAWTSSLDEWDDFEWNYQRIVERNAASAIDDENAAAKLAQRREWMDAYLKWGRNTLGFGTYLFQKPRGDQT